MFGRLLFVFMLGLAAAQAGDPPPPAGISQEEPDGSHPAGRTPAFSGQPAPPPELRALSHKQAMVDTEHYLYEAYAAEEAGGGWLVRYVLLPEGNEAYREIEQVFLFAVDLGKKPKGLKPQELQVETHSVRWKGKAFRLVDRRDLTTHP